MSVDAGFVRLYEFIRIKLHAASGVGGKLDLLPVVLIARQLAEFFQVIVVPTDIDGILEFSAGLIHGAPGQGNGFSVHRGGQALGSGGSVWRKGAGGCHRGIASGALLAGGSHLNHRGQAEYIDAVCFAFEGVACSRAVNGFLLGGAVDIENVLAGTAVGGPLPGQGNGAILAIGGTWGCRQVLGRAGRLQLCRHHQRVGGLTCLIFQALFFICVVLGPYTEHIVGIRFGS